MPSAKVSNWGWLVLVRFENGSIFTLAPLTSETCDLNGTDCQDRKHERDGISWHDALTFLQDVAKLQTEDATPPGVAAYSPANAFAAPGQKINRGTEASERMGWQRVNEIDRLKHPFGEDALGRDAMNGREKKHSEGKKKSAIAHNFESGSPLSLGESTAGNETLFYLQEMLPCDSAEIEGSKLTVTADAVAIVVTQNGGDKFSVQSFVGGEPVSDASNIGAAETIKLCFQVCGLAQSKAAEIDDTGADDVSSSDAFSVLKELAKETGAYGGDDILRNKNLVDLNGLVVSKPPFNEGKRVCSWCNKSMGENPNIEGTTHGICPQCRDKMKSQTVTESFVRGGTWHNGHPVRLCENNAAKPYADTLGGKVLRYVHGIGCVFVDKKDLPKERFLSWNASKGHVELVEGKENVKRPSWHWRGWKR